MIKLNRKDYLLSVCLAIALGAALYATTPLGLGMSPDSVGYIMGARGIAADNSLKDISNHWPPLYPLALGCIAKLTNLDVLLSARLLQSVLLSCLVGSLILIQIRVGIRRYAVVLSTALVIINPTLLYIIYYVWSECLFFFLLFINIYFAAKLIETQHERQSLNATSCLLAITASLAFASRYIGITLVLFNIILFIYIQHKHNPVKKLLFIYISTCAIISTPWIVYYSQASETLTRRELTWHPLTLDQLELGVRTIGQSLLPFKSEHGYLHIIVGLLTLTATLFTFRSIYRNQKITNAAIFQLLLLFYAFIYFSFLIFSISLFDIATPLDERILFPICSIIILVLSSYVFNNKMEKQFFYVFIAIFLTIYICLCTYNAHAWIKLNVYSGVELSAKSNRDRPILAYLSKCPREYKITSNAPWEFEINLNRKLFWLPRPFDMTSGRANERFENQIQNLANRFDVIVVTQGEKNIYKGIGPNIGYIAAYSGNDGLIWMRQDRLGSCSSNPN